jgi:ferrous iron transport protein B
MHCSSSPTGAAIALDAPIDRSTARTHALIGHPNVGKSVIFHRLTGTYVNVSNYPGTTVEVARASARFARDTDILDTPGVLTLPARSDDERATMRALLHEDLRALVQVGDAKHLRRTLALTLTLAEARLPLALALNMHDESTARGVSIDGEALAAELGIDVVTTVATAGDGIGALVRALRAPRVAQRHLRYPPSIERAIGDAERCIDACVARPPIATRALATLFLGGDGEVERWLGARLGSSMPALVALRERAAAEHGGNLAGALAAARSAAADAIADKVLRSTARTTLPLAARVGRVAVHRVWSVPILFAVLFAVYEFVGVFGAGTLVKLTEEQLFGNVLNPALAGFVRAHAGWPWLADLLVGPYGLWTMGMTYAIALILPIVTTFFIAFGVLEDSGYFARLSVLANRAFAAIGLNGRAVLPMVLGLGCVTMGTLTTRILHTRREKLIATFLMALAIPCSAQLGVVMGMLGGLGFGATLAWLAALGVTLLAAGRLAAMLVPGRRIPLVTEMPPMRLPVAANVLKKTAARLRWYLVEVIPLFLLGTLLMFALDKTGALPWIVARGEPLVTGWLGLPKEASAAFVMGFLRRDFGATGLFAMGHALTSAQTIVGMVTITLFVPCIASVMMIVKEQGVRTAALMIAMIVPTAFGVGGVVNLVLKALG